MIVARGVTHRFDDREVLRNISLEVPAGEIYVIMGSSGGGKTTLLRCVAGLIEASEGEVTIDGIDMRTQPEEARARMGMVFQSAALFDSMTVEDNVGFGLRRRFGLNGDALQSAVQSALDRVQLSTEDGAKLPAELSGGMRKRVGMARAIALRPSVMLYDEPTTGLDPVTAAAIDEVILEMRAAQPVSSLLVSHDLAAVSRVADRIGFLHQGELVFEGTYAEFLQSPHPAIQDLLQKAQPAAAEAAQ